MSYDVLIVGGGVMGSATAYHLMVADPGVSVLVIEKDASYTHASTVLSDGNVRVQFSLEENIRISQHTLAVLETFADDMATEHYRPEVGAAHQGNLFMVDETGRPAALAGLELQNSLGCDIEWLESPDVAALFPPYASVGLAGGTLGRRDGSVDPSAVLHGYRAKAIEMGARYIEDEVKALRAGDDRILGVHCPDAGELDCAVVINAAGGWSPALARTVGVELPVTPIMRTVYVVSSSVSSYVLPSIFLPSGVHALPERDNTWLMAWSQPADPESFDYTPVPHQRFTDVVWPALIESLPAFDQLRVEGSWAGVYAVNTLDANAIVGEWPLIRGLYIVTGFSGHGFQQSPAMGRYLTELVLDLPHELDLKRLGPQRVLDGEPLHEHAGRII